VQGQKLEQLEFNLVDCYEHLLILENFLQFIALLEHCKQLAEELFEPG